jgi:NAD(P)-dependent dehydrogenase (short-subunit alcohol dehydrogenase family)
MTGRLTGKSAIITGATSGIGRIVAERFHAEGARVLVTGRDEARGEAVARDLGDGCVFVPADITDPAAVQNVVTSCVAEFGALDVLVNNAALDYNGDLLDSPAEEIRKVFEVNVFATIGMLQAAARAMLAHGGSIVNVTSRLATIGVPTMGVYSSSKGAIRSLTRSAAVELAPHGIRVNDVAPGLTSTPLYEAWLGGYPDPVAKSKEVAADIPLGRVATPDDVASAILYLASDESGYITGTTLPVDGGYTAQ